MPGTAALVVPPNATAQDIRVKLEVAEPALALPGAAASKIVAITPHGATFNLPARVSLNYQGDSAGLLVYRLADDAATEWTPVGGVAFESGVATFETTTFSYYAVVAGASCTSPYDPKRCSSKCECCGGARCAEMKSSANCGACGVTCTADQFCSTTNTCASALTTALCENSNLMVIHGALPTTTVVYSYEQTTDGIHAATIAGQIAANCGLTVQNVSQSQAGILDPCSNEPVVGGGTTMVVVGGAFGQRAAKFLDANIAPLYLKVATNGTRTFYSRGGTAPVSFPESAETDRHDYFAISLVTEPKRGALILYVYGIGWEGTPAAAWYFTNVVYPEMRAGTRTWTNYLLVEWTDNGDGVKNAGDTWNVIAKDVP